MKRRGASGVPEEQQALVESRDDNSDSDSDDEAQPDFVEQRSWLGNLAVAVRYVWAENLKQKRNFFVGATAVFLVVFSIGLLQNTVENSPVLFLKLAEENIGEMDLIMTPKRTATSNSYFLNSTEIALKLKDEPLCTGVSPRWVFLSRVINTKDTNRNSSAVILAIDSQQESKIGMGRAWTHPTLVGRKAHVSSALLRLIGVKANANETARLQVDALSLLLTVSGAQTSEQAFVQQLVGVLSGTIPSNATSIPGLDQLPTIDPVIVRAVLASLGIDADALARGENVDIGELKRRTSLSIDLVVEDGVDESAGKYPKALGNVVVLEKQLINDVINEFLRNVSHSIPKNMQELFTFFDINDPLQQIVLASYIRTTIPNLFEIIKNATAEDPNFDITHYAITVIAMYSQRFTVYLQDKLAIDTATIQFSDRVIEWLGIHYPVTLTTPLVSSLGLVYYLRLLLDQLLNVIEIFLVCLGMFLIYALLLSDVEAKVYESGMLRALGMQQYTLIMLLSVQSIMFSIPGIALGLLVAYLAFIPVGNALANFTLAPVPLVLTGSAIGLSVGVGFVMPLVSLIGPVQRALGKTLRDALDLYHTVINDVTVTITKLENLGLSPLQLNSSLLMVSFGFVVYYLIPMSFIFLNLVLFFNIFVAILLGLLLGLSILGMVAHPLCQRISLEIIMWGHDRRVLKSLVRKNLLGHARRNAKTAILFTTCIAFIIFAGSVFTLQGKNLVDNVKVGLGADVLVASFGSNPDFALDEDALSEHLEHLKVVEGENTVIDSYSFATFSINDLKYISWTQLTNLAEYPSYRCLIYAVDENFLDAAYDQFFVVQEAQSDISYSSTPNGKKDVVRSLFQNPSAVTADNTLKGNIPPVIGSMKGDSNAAEWYIIDRSNNEIYNYSITAIYSEAVRYPISVNTKTPVQFVTGIVGAKTEKTWTNYRIYYLGYSRAMVSKMPGFFFSSYQQTAGGSVVVISMKQYYEMMQLAHSNSYLKDEPLPSKPPKRAMFLKLKSGATFEQRDALTNGLRNFLKSDRIQLTDTAEIITATDTAITILNLFFNVVAMIVLILCFFTLLVSFTSNVNENAWEFGVLRSLGLNGAQAIRVYIYEAMAVIIASVFLGFIIGTVVAITLTLQADLFSELPFQMNFPTLLFISILVMSIVVSLGGSYIPANALRKKKIASALKNM